MKPMHPLRPFLSVAITSLLGGSLVVLAVKILFAGLSKAFEGVLFVGTCTAITAGTGLYGFKAQARKWLNWVQGIASLGDPPDKKG